MRPVQRQQRRRFKRGRDVFVGVLSGEAEMVGSFLLVGDELSEPTVNSHAASVAGIGVDP
jgi:hypothetical protein